MRTGRIRFWRLAIFLGVILAGAEGAGFRDDFEGGTVDAELWDVVLPYTNSPISRVEVQEGRLELFRRGILEAKTGIEGGVDIEGLFGFLTGDDVLTLVLRSDLSEVEQHERLGLQVLFQNKDMRLIVLSEPFVGERHVGSFSFGPGGGVRFRVTDDGSLVRVYVGSMLNAAMTVEVAGGWGDRMALYDSISTSGGISMDYISAEPLETTILLDGERVRDGAVVKQGAPASVVLQGHWPGGQVFYTLDGTVPSFVKQRYSGPFILGESARIRAVTYSGDFQRSMASGVVDFELLPRHTVSDGTVGGGVVEMDPPGGIYYAGTEVALSAGAEVGWEFLGWEGDVGGTNEVVQLVVTNDMEVRAVFGTRPAWVVVGSEPGVGGVLSVEPEMEVVPYGTVLELDGVPDAGSYFFGWANSVSGSVSPVFLSVVEAMPSVTALFAKLEPTQVTLDVEIEGAGLVLLDPARNVFERGELVQMEAVPAPGMLFGGWGGEVSGVEGWLDLVMDADKRVTARFVEGFGLSVVRSDGALSLEVQGGLGAVYSIERSLDLQQWESMVMVTNEVGTVIPLDIGTGASGYYRASLVE